MTILLTSLVSAGQTFVNPDTIGQAGDIYLQNTDVYYKPMAPPGPMDTRANLSNESDMLGDPNGVGNYWRGYVPIIFQDSVHGYVPLQNWSPKCDSPFVLGPNAYWQRLFTAKRDGSGHTHDIIAGGIDTVKDTIIVSIWPFPPDKVINTLLARPSVIVSANEDVDFRASGRVKLKSGFHVKPGAFFHAYTEPKWGDTVFSDDFNDTGIFHNNWRIGKGWNDPNGGAECSADSNARLVPDPDAHDGWALDLILREGTNDTCLCDYVAFGGKDTNNCAGINPGDSTPVRFAFTSAMPVSCPFPYTSANGSLGQVAYAHMPYGKYEFRDKVPHTLHHTNNWGFSWDAEFDLDETVNAAMGDPQPNWNHQVRYGPFNGIFQIIGTDTVFICPTAGWGRHNIPQGIIINNVLYQVAPFSVTSNASKSDTVAPANETAFMGGFPTSIINTTDSTQFYYETVGIHTADTVTWHISADDSGYLRIFSAPWDISGVDSQLFTKSYQPVTLTLTTQGLPHPGTKTYTCHWVDSLNDPHNYGKIRLDVPLSSGDLDSNTEAFQYTLVNKGTQSFGYPVAPYIIDRDTALWSNQWKTDSSGYDSTAYRYHTFTMEYLPHEVRFLVDSVVIRRFPDRLVPRSSPYYDYVTTQARSPMTLYPAEIDIDGVSDDPLANHSGTDSHGNDTSISYMMRSYFETHTTNPGFGDVTIGGVTYHAAHHLVDYVKVWDVPKDVIIPDYPH